MSPRILEQAPATSAGSLEDSKALFIRRWGEMSSYWGINRTMAEIHALLYVSTQPICTDDVMALLQVSRGNASMNLRLLVDWGLVQRIHVRGDRKEYFAAIADVWQMFETIIRQRKRREVEPILETIARCRELASKEASQQKGPKAAEAKVYLDRMKQMDNFLTILAAFAEMLLKVGPKGMDRITGLMLKLKVVG
jgi:DNA-binding transcriptional regulator GbsR (MarR family)